MRAWLDTESNGFEADLISIGIIDENNNEFYEVLECLNPTEWIIENVIPKLLKKPISIIDLKVRLKNFLRDNEIDYIIADWPYDFRFFIELLIHERNYLGPSKLTIEIRNDLIYPVDKEKEHNALNDARALKKYYLEQEFKK